MVMRLPRAVVVKGGLLSEVRSSKGRQQMVLGGARHPRTMVEGGTVVKKQEIHREDERDYV